MYFGKIFKDVRLITEDAFNKAIEEGKKKGHTYIKFMRMGYADRVVSLDSTAFKNISGNLEGHGVYAVRTGYPVFSNCNRHAYTPYVSGVTEKPNSSYGAGLMSFINN